MRLIKGHPGVVHISKLVTILFLARRPEPSVHVAQTMRIFHEEP